MSTFVERSLLSDARMIPATLSLSNIDAEKRRTDTVIISITKYLNILIAVFIS